MWMPTATRHCSSAPRAHFIARIRLAHGNAEWVRFEKKSRAHLTAARLRAGICRKSIPLPSPCPLLWGCASPQHQQPAGRPSARAEDRRRRAEPDAAGRRRAKARRISSRTTLDSLPWPTSPPTVRPNSCCPRSRSATTRRRSTSSSRSPSCRRWRGRRCPAAWQSTPATITQTRSSARWRDSVTARRERNRSKRH